MQGDLHGGEKATFVPVEQRRIAAFTHKTQRFTWFTLLLKVWHPFCSTGESLSRKQLLLMDCNIERSKRCRSEGFGCCLDLQWVPWIPPQCGNVDRRPVPADGVLFSARSHSNDPASPAGFFNLRRPIGIATTTGSHLCSNQQRAKQRLRAGGCSRSAYERESSRGSAALRSRGRTCQS